MGKATVFHYHHPEINGGYTVFNGEDLEVDVRHDGSLIIDNYQTPDESGYAIFAKSVWGYVCVSHSRE